MSSSPKFTVIDLAADLIAAERAGVAARAQARRERQQRRDEEFARLRAERAGRATEDERSIIAARLTVVSAVLGAVPVGNAASAGAVAALAAQVAELRAGLASAAGNALADCLSDAERLRDRAVALSARAQGAADHQAGRLALLTALRERVAAPGDDAALLDPGGYRQCADLLAQLDTAALDEGVRFDALRGTVEHVVSGYAQRGTAAAGAARAARDEAADLLATLGAGVASAAADARELSDDDLARKLETALAGANDALTAARADPATSASALARARDVADLLAETEGRLDELTVAFERRAAFADTLKEVLAEHGMSFLGTTETRDRFILQFERPGGALYTAAVDDGENDELMLSYAIDGEADIPVLPEPGQAACDQTEAFLEAIHADLQPDGYHAGELHWEGKSTPRGPRTQQTRTDSRRRRTLRESP
jgi:hypothetical protein